MPQEHPFQTSFWSPTASVDNYPNFRYGFDILHKKLAQSVTENEAIANYIQERIEAERHHGTQLSKLPHPELDELTTLSRCFQVVWAESEASATEHWTRAENLHTTALDPLKRLASRYSRIVSNAKQTLEQQMSQFETLVKQLEQAKSVYHAKCRSLLTIQPNYRPTVIQLGTLLFYERFQVEDWMRPLNETGLTRREIVHWLQDKHQSPSVMHDLIGLHFLRQIGQDQYEKVVRQPVSKGLYGLFKWQQQQQQQQQQPMEPYVRDMLQADKAYRELVIKVDKMRMQTEEALFMHYEEMESLELERIQTIKQVFISVAASLSNTIPRYKETVDNMMLYQETLKPDKDVQVIVEQHRTGQFCPRPVLYENYFYGAAHHQLFGVALDEVTRTEGTLIPNFMSKGMSVIESGLANLEAEEKHLVWITSLPLDRVHAARDQINQQYPVISQELLESYDVLLIASLIRLYLMELPECLLTFELYEPCKIIYSNQQDTETRLVSVSKLLTTLPTPNYHMCKVLFSHLNKLCDDQTLSRRFAHSFGYVLLRPQVESKVSTFERHPYRLIQDLIEHYDSIFTTESTKAQEENSSRTSIVVSKTSLDSLDSSRRRIRGHLIPSSSTLFEDPDELTSESTMNSTPPNYVGKEDTLELASLDSFFLDDE